MTGPYNLNAVTGSAGGLAYVRISVNGTGVENNHFQNSDGIYKTDVDIIDSGMGAWDEGL